MFCYFDVWKWLRRKWIKAYKDHPENSKRYLFAKAESPSPLLFSNYDLDLLFWRKKSEFSLSHLPDLKYYHKKALLILRIYARQCVLQEPFDVTPGQKEIRNQIKIRTSIGSPVFDTIRRSPPRDVTNGSFDFN